MNKVIGPIDKITWQTMRDLRESVRDYGQDEKYAIAKDKETRIYNHLLTSVTD